MAVRQPQGRDSWQSASVGEEGWALMGSPQVRTCSLEKRQVGGTAPGERGWGRRTRNRLTHPTAGPPCPPASCPVVQGGVVSASWQVHPRVDLTLDEQKPSFLLPAVCVLSTPFSR